ncbi:MAG: hypothetical protein BRD47_03530 [Bacteroidetes bacterium QS_8_68_28]|nr:MAG: hypothetical protein BRD47_03530 [Bacteroidetes bacterium QS_8_68_28]
MPSEAKLMLTGRVLKAYMFGEMTYQESRPLRGMLALPREALRFRSFALTGDVKEYQELVDDGGLAAVSQS